MIFNGKFDIFIYCTGQNDIKKLRRENEQLRREIWGLREQYDRLEGLLGKAKRRGSKGEDTDSGVRIKLSAHLNVIDHIG